MPSELTETADMRRADAIRIERVRQRLHQDEVARKAEVTQPTVSKAENGIGSDETYAAIARVLGIELPEAAQ